MNESHIQTAENEISLIKERIADREKTMAFLKIQNDTDIAVLKTFEKGLKKLREQKTSENGSN